MLLTNVIVAAVQDGLIATHALANASQGLNDPQAKLLPLHGLADSNVLDVSDLAKVAQELALNEDASDADDLIRLLRDDDKGVVGLRAPHERVKGGLVALSACIWCLCQNRQDG
jgi:hypothetical protein